MFKNFRKDLDELKLQHTILERYWNPDEQISLLDFFVKILPELTEAERCSIFIIDPANDQVWLKAGTGVTERQIEVPSTSSIAGKVIHAGSPIITDQVDQESGVHMQIDAATGFITRNVLCVPIQGLEKGQVIGAIECLNKRSGDFSEDDQALLSDAARYISLFVESIYLNQHISTLSSRVYLAEKRALRIVLLLLVVGAIGLLLFLSSYAFIPRLLN